LILAFPFSVAARRRKKEYRRRSNITRRLIIVGLSAYRLVDRAEPKMVS
jgi:hypothetical protein